MGIAERVAYWKFQYHSSMISVIKLMYVLGIIEGYDADNRNRKHFMKAMDAWGSMDDSQKRGFGRR